MTYISAVPTSNLANEVNRLIVHTLRPYEKDNAKIDTNSFMPLIDILNEPKQFIIYADLPGVEKKNINISIDNNLLTITGSRSNKSADNSSDYLKMERLRGNFIRKLPLPETADTLKIVAKLIHGVLEITIPKKEAALSRIIEIQSDG